MSDYENYAKFVQTLNDKVVVLDTTVLYLERDISQHKLQTEKQFEALNNTIADRFNTIDSKIDQISEAVTGHRVNIAKILSWGTVGMVIIGALATSISRVVIG